MSLNTCIPDGLPHLSEHPRPSSLHLHPHNPAVLKHGPRGPPLNGNRTNRYAKSANRCLRSSPPRRNPRSSHPCSYYYRNNQPIYPTFGLGGTTNGKPNGRTPPYATYCYRGFRSATTYAHHRNPYRRNSSSTYNLRSGSRPHPSLRICPTSKPVPTRKRITMAHQAHAYHIVDPSP